MTDQSPIRVDIVSDVVCPWCVIGYLQLVKGAEASATALDIYWHPFELNPHMAPEGENLREHIAAKYGTSPDDSAAARTRLTALGASLGFTFDYADDMRMYNTFLAHQLIDWAARQGKGHAAKQALFTAFFTRRETVSDIQTLAKIAEHIGLDRSAAETVLTNGDQAALVREKQQFWTQRGIQGVPAMIFERQHLVSGAQGEETYARILDHLKQERAA